MQGLESKANDSIICLIEWWHNMILKWSQITLFIVPIHNIKKLTTYTLTYITTLFLFSYHGDPKQLQLGALVASYIDYLMTSNVIGSILSHVQNAPLFFLFAMFIPFPWPQRKSFRQPFHSPLKKCLLSLSFSLSFFPGHKKLFQATI